MSKQKAVFDTSPALLITPLAFSFLDKLLALSQRRKAFVKREGEHA
jgi:hypothetical protein